MQNKILDRPEANINHSYEDILMNLFQQMLATVVEIIRVV